MSENLTTYSKLDPGSRYSNDGTTLTITALPRNEQAYFYYDFGAGYWSGNCQADFIINTTGGGGSANVGISYGPIWSTTLVGGGSLVDAAGHAANINAGKTAPYGQAIQWSSSAATGTVNANRSLSTTYYVRTGLYTSLSKFGSALSQYFSDSGRTTLLDSVKTNRTANASYRYFIVSDSLSDAKTAYISLTEGTFNLSRPAVGLDLTTFTETDPSTYIDPVANCVTVTSLPTNVVAHHNKDYGASHFNSNFTARGSFVISAITAGGTLPLVALCNFTNTVSAGDTTAVTNCQGFMLFQNAGGSGTSYKFAAREVVTLNEYLSSYSNTLTTADNQSIWWELQRDTTVGTYGTLYLRLYNDPDYLSQIGTTMSLTLHASVSWRYLYSMQSMSNQVGTQLSSFTIGGITIAASTPQTIATSQASETNLAQAIAVVVSAITIAIGQPAEVDAAQVITPALSLNILPVGQVVETDTAQAISGFVGAFYPVGQATETDVAQAMVVQRGAVTITVGQVTEIDSAQLFGVGTPTAALKYFYAIFDSLTGTPRMKILRGADSYKYDWGDAVFKAGTVAQLGGIMTRTAPSDWSNMYGVSVDVLSWNYDNYILYAYDDGDATSYSFDNYKHAADALTDASIAAQVRTNLTVELNKITEFHRLEGLDIANPLVVKVDGTRRTAGAGINQTIVTDATNTTVTRQP